MGSGFATVRLNLSQITTYWSLMCAKKNKTKKLYINIYLDWKEIMMEMIMLFCTSCWQMTDSLHKNLLNSKCCWTTWCRWLSSLQKGTNRDPFASGWLWPEAASDSHSHRSRSLPPTSSEASRPGSRTHPPGSICHITAGWWENVLKHVVI